MPNCRLAVSQCREFPQGLLPFRVLRLDNIELLAQSFLFVPVFLQQQLFLQSGFLFLELYKQHLQVVTVFALLAPLSCRENRQVYSVDFFFSS